MKLHLIRFSRLIFEAEMSNPFFNIWLPYIYLYGVGGICFSVGLYLAKKSGAYNPARKRHRYWWHIIIGGFFYFMLLHLIWILIALNT